MKNINSHISYYEHAISSIASEIAMYRHFYDGRYNDI